MRLIIDELVKNYNGQMVLDHINLNIENISSIGIVGQSGCGKSTLLRQLSGIEKPDSGSIQINELSPILDGLGFKNNIGVVFQKHNLFPHLSIEKNITLILEKVLKEDKVEAKDKTLSLLKQLRIEEQAHKKPSQVSGGQAQRASIARALATNPELIFLDEPTAALDPLMTKEVLSAIGQLKENGKEFIFVTHEIQFLRQFADYIVFMDQGRIIEHGNIDILEAPKTEMLREFLKGCN